MQVSVGDLVSVEVVTSDGLRNFDRFLVKGIYRFPGVSELFTGHMVVSSLSSVQRLMNAPEAQVTEILVNTKSVAAGAGLDEKSFSAVPDLSSLSWGQYGSLILSVAKAMIISIWVIFGVTMTVIFVFLFDTILSTVEERRKELGIMFSMGLSASQIFGLMLTEFFILGLLFVIPGGIAGGVISSIIGYVGIAIPGEALKVVLGGLERLHPIFDFRISCVIVLGIIGIILYVAAVSLSRITKMKPVESLKE
jgi:ABC-type lipoprotein release transport system permease subunit